MDAYIKINEEYTAVIAIPQSSSGDTVAVTVIKASDGSTFASGNATWIAGEYWKYAFTPDTEDEIYIVKMSDTTITSIREGIFKCAGADITLPESPADGDLTTLANFKQQFGITTANHNSLLSALISQQSEWIKKYTKRDLVDTTYSTQTQNTMYDGDGDDTIILKQYPIISITSVHDDSEYTFDATTLIASSDYILDKETGLVILKASTFSKGKRNIQILYRAGYATIPADLELACQQRVMASYMEDVNGVNAKAGEELIYKPGKLYTSSMKIIDLYKSTTIR